MDNFITIFCISYVLSATGVFFARKKNTAICRTKKKKLIKVLMYKHSVEDLHCVYHELIVYCKKGGRRPSKHTQKITESSVLPNYNPTDAVKKISEEDWRKEKKTQRSVIISSNSADSLRSLFLHSPSNQSHNCISLW